MVGSGLLLEEPLHVRRDARCNGKVLTLLSLLCGLGLSVHLTSIGRPVNQSKFFDQVNSMPAVRNALDKTTLGQILSSNVGPRTLLHPSAASRWPSYRRQFYGVATPALPLNNRIDQSFTAPLTELDPLTTEDVDQGNQVRDVSMQAGKGKGKGGREKRKKGKKKGGGAASVKEDDDEGSSDTIKMEGEVTNVLSNGFFKVELENGFEILATVSGKMRMFKIWVALGDSVTVSISPYDLTKGRIISREIKFKRPPPPTSRR
eukprot:gnl/TRDRNA2_/TRDRNA2_188909_c0_seq1.p1 gnl/TRDRNA2_/TRDRNA2_188909_c0~~gnl/TRDRNA2_/TRDRNA2_188909_c0_seq1.p1  ORF type:complete len:261 (-),score=26.63 gnl/TRDRNA2_/TRDRNA2_188909_c0_seq1:239-1021(-)